MENLPGPNPKHENHRAARERRLKLDHIDSLIGKHRGELILVANRDLVRIGIIACAATDTIRRRKHLVVPCYELFSVDPDAQDIDIDNGVYEISPDFQLTEIAHLPQANRLLRVNFQFSDSPRHIGSGTQKTGVAAIGDEEVLNLVNSKDLDTHMGFGFRAREFIANTAHAMDQRDNFSVEQRG